MKQAREAKGLGVRELSRRVDVSASLISQIEHGRAMPSVMTLYAVSSELDVSLDELFGESGISPAASMDVVGAEEGTRRVHRKDERKSIRFSVGVTWDLLNPGGTNGVEFLHVTYEPKGASTAEDALLRHQGMEYGWVESGQPGSRSASRPRSSRKGTRSLSRPPFRTDSSTHRRPSPPPRFGS